MIKNKETGWSEATIVVNGHELSFAESMTVRVALESYAMWLHSNREELGAGLAGGYIGAIDGVRRKMYQP